MMRKIAWVLLLVPALAGAAGDPFASLGGHVEADAGGRRIALPTLKTEVGAVVRGDAVIVTTVQYFANPSGVPIDATYVFPLDDEAAVRAMELRCGDDVVRARIERADRAREDYARARDEGRRAALLVQHRPNMFTQDVANLMPGEEVIVTFVHVQPVRRVDGRFQLVLPLVMGPRFQPPGASTPLPDLATVEGLDAPPPSDVEADRVGIEVTLDAGLPLHDVASPSHRVLVEREGSAATVRLAGGARVANRDFVLEWSVRGPATAAGAVAEPEARGGVLSVLVEPPLAAPEEPASPREMVFLLDCSGSMSGLPIEASKAYVKEALRTLRPGDAFRIIRFSDAATEMSAQPLPATPESVARGIAYVESLEGEGGTMMTAGIAQALTAPKAEGALRLVLFLTDGYIGNELDVLRQVREQLGDARLFAFGVGGGVNRYLLDELAHAGRGFVRYMDPSESVTGVATEMARKLETPVLTDVSIEWGGARVVGAFPSVLPDLFAGDGLRVLAAYEGAPPKSVTVVGTVAGRRERLVAPVTTAATQGPLRTSYARAEIQECMRQMRLPIAQRDDALPDDLIQARVTRIGLEQSLVTQWTSFVAVSDRIVNPGGGAEHANVPRAMVEGLSPAAYGERRMSAKAPRLSGTPEPDAALLLVGCVSALLIGWLLRRGA